jgi:hypothetical protein
MGVLGSRFRGNECAFPANELRILRKAPDVYSILNRDKATGRRSAIFDQQRKYDHLHSVLRNLMAVDQALATRHQLPDERAVAARMRAAVPVGAEVQHSFPCFGRRPRLWQRHQRVVAAKPIVALHSGRIDQSAIGHKN